MYRHTTRIQNSRKFSDKILVHLWSQLPVFFFYKVTIANNILWNLRLDRVKNVCWLYLLLILSGGDKHKPILLVELLHLSWKHHALYLIYRRRIIHFCLNLSTKWSTPITKYPWTEVHKQKYETHSALYFIFAYFISRTNSGSENTYNIYFFNTIRIKLTIIIMIHESNFTWKNILL